ncbi:MFS transporter [Paenarthrobacter nicotinovorans]|uniref:MFS transporter n=1 Tax=Paenarthrobacter nicotinovorans TaxID=29320 RepID=UPI002785E640|nr:MFS transporter [Paenarthrobacter nicotinovorans]MDP9935030.1 CP family cyanate transporter-like MFS transporter [Paenarthrobacter nicotinovorans]
MSEQRRAVPQSSGRRSHVPTALVLLALVLVSVNLRPAITTVAGVMAQVPGAFGLDPALLPLLGTLPVLAFGVSGPIGPWLARRLGTGRAVAVALLVLAAALIIRSTVPALLLPGTFLAGMAIMTASVLVPQIVKANRGTGWWTGLCTMGFGLGAALGAGLVQPLELTFGGNLASALAVWAVPALIGAFLIHRSGGRPTAALASSASVTTAVGATAVGAKADGAPGAPSDVPPSDVSTPLRRQRTAWAVTAFFGLQAMLYFAITSWLAVYLVSCGLGPADAAALLAWFSLAGLPASLLAPVLASRSAILRILAPGLGLSVAAALLGVLAAPAELQFVAVGILGVVQSAGFGLGMALMVIRSAGPESAGKLSAMSQGFGFALASLGPLLAGLLHEITGGWEVTFCVLAAEAVVLAVAGFFAIRGPLVSVGPGTVRGQSSGVSSRYEQLIIDEPAK